MTVFAFSRIFLTVEELAGTLCSRINVLQLCSLLNTESTNTAVIYNTHTHTHMSEKSQHFIRMIYCTAAAAVAFSKLLTEKIVVFLMLTEKDRGKKCRMIYWFKLDDVCSYVTLSTFWHWHQSLKVMTCPQSISIYTRLHRWRSLHVLGCCFHYV